MQFKPGRRFKQIYRRATWPMPRIRYARLSRPRCLPTRLFETGSLALAGSPLRQYATIPKSSICHANAPAVPIETALYELLGVHPEASEGKPFMSTDMRRIDRRGYFAFQTISRKPTARRCVSPSGNLRRGLTVSCRRESTIRYVAYRTLIYHCLSGDPAPGQGACH